MEANPEQLAERYLSAVDDFVDAFRRLNSDDFDRSERPDTWTFRDVAFHVTDVDQMLGLRLRRILGEDYPALAGANTQAGVELFRRGKLDPTLALDALQASAALNTALIERLTPEDVVRKGRHSQGHDVTAGDLAAFMAMHIEAHIKQVRRIAASLD
jgi:hypothetical protein